MVQKIQNVDTKHCLGTGHPLFYLGKYRSKSNFLLSKCGKHFVTLVSHGQIHKVTYEKIYNKIKLFK